GYAPSSAPAAPSASAPVASAPTFTAPRGGSHVVGGSLSPAEIQKLMEHAGAGCPLGPCKGCAHQNVATGACTA
ncbi:MAG: hypothetical protein HUU28_07575, partial [Planctomycetaceae bacterium]|nr:hypothetical protein [Planctomycetaceae bacterium]